MALALAPRHRPLLGHDALAFFHVNLVAEHDEREVVRIVRTRLNEELIAPAVERLKALGIVDIVHQHAAVRAAVERHAERLESLLTGRVPQLHRDQAAIDHDLARQKVRADRRLVGGRKALIHIWRSARRRRTLVHQRCLADTRVAQNLSSAACTRTMTCTLA